MRKYDSYKSIWHEDEAGNYRRRQKQTYPLEFLCPEFFKNIPKLKALYRFIGKKEQGVDYYKYYVDVIKSGINKQNWEKEHVLVEKELQEFTSLENKRIQDVSGEPGFFAQDLKKKGNEVIVTAFAEEVSQAIISELGLSTITYDFNCHELSKIIEGKFDIVFIRYAIGFCENLSSFVKDLKGIVSKEGIVYISFSPASRAVMARWMFDDYTYLRQYTRETMIKAFEENGFELTKEIDRGSYFWNKGLGLFQKLLSMPYLKNIFESADSREYYQHNVVMVFKLA